jgi:hypothetical protein
MALVGKRLLSELRLSRDHAHDMTFVTASDEGSDLPLRSLGETMKKRPSRASGSRRTARRPASVRRNLLLTEHW